jgi:hypothetical protein
MPRLRVIFQILGITDTSNVQMAGMQLPFPENSPSVLAVKHDLLYVIPLQPG